jgi:hypothetical protein
LHLNKVKSEVIALVPNYDKADDSPYVPTFRNIQIEDVSCKTAGKSIVIHGWEDQPVTGVFLKNMNLRGVKEPGIVVTQSEDIILEDILINGERQDRVIEKIAGDELPPVMI